MLFDSLDAQCCCTIEKIRFTTYLLRLCRSLNWTSPFRAFASVLCCGVFSLTMKQREATNLKVVSGLLSATIKPNTTQNRACAALYWLCFMYECTSLFASIALKRRFCQPCCPCVETFHVRKGKRSGCVPQRKKMDTNPTRIVQTCCIHLCDQANVFFHQPHDHRIGCHTIEQTRSIAAKRERGQEREREREREREHAHKREHAYERESACTRERGRTHESERERAHERKTIWAFSKWSCGHLQNGVVGIYKMELWAFTKWSCGHFEKMAEDRKI